MDSFLVDNNILTTKGLVIASLLLLFYFFINYWTVNLFAKANSFITIFKLIVPGVMAGSLFFAGFHSENFTSYQGIAPYGWASVLTAVATSGIVFAFNGFQSPVNMAGEAKSPNKSIPIAVIGSILIAGFIYIILQVVFIGAVNPSMIVNGWNHLNFNSPFADLAIALGINWLAIVLYVDAFVSPSGSGATYTATTSRMLYGMQQNGYLPNIFGTLHPLYSVPRPAMLLNLAYALCFYFYFADGACCRSDFSCYTYFVYHGASCIGNFKTYCFSF